MEYIIRKLEKFYYLYEELIIKDRAYYLAIIIDDNKITMNIVKSGEIEEVVELVFCDKERKLYEYLVIRLFLTILGNVVIHNDKNILVIYKKCEFLSRNQGSPARKPLPVQETHTTCVSTITNWQAYLYDMLPLIISGDVFPLVCYAFGLAK